MSAANDPFGDVRTTEQRIRDKEEQLGIDPIEVLHQEIAKRLPRFKELAGRYAYMAVWEAKRKAFLSVIAVEIRDALTTAGTKMTDSAVSDKAHADPRYVAFIDQSIMEKAEFEVLQIEIQNIREKTNRGQALLRAYSSETLMH